jgi:hypothetical protein
MKFKQVMGFWFCIFVFLNWEYYALNFHESFSVLKGLQTSGLIKDSFQISKQPGRDLSLLLGWLGLGLMIVMNAYSLRKRATFLANVGRLSSWLNFHIFCGLVGPTLILFHCNFKVRGLVGISFWSMVVALASGLIGRYFYVQILQSKKKYDINAENDLQRLEGVFKRRQITLSSQEKDLYTQKALVWAGIPPKVQIPGILSAVAFSVQGDFRLFFGEPEIPSGWPEKSKWILKNYALNRRRSFYLQPFQQLMAYWHAFHFPFAIFMYVSAFIHVLAALIFQV